MKIRTFFNKSNTIIANVKTNYGLYPVNMLYYGNALSRILVSFDLERLKELRDRKILNTSENVSHVLKMTNCASLNQLQYKGTHRATSFKIIAFKINEEWDAGVGFDDAFDFWLTGEGKVSTDASNWRNRKTETPWENSGIYTSSMLEKEYNKFLEGEESIVIGEQDFDYGNEDLCLDVTNYINNVLDTDTEFYGIGLAYGYTLENSADGCINYVGFFNNNTNTHFKPCLETTIDAEIYDSRYNFYLDKVNKLYLTTSVNLDELPTCTINGTEYEVHQESEGIYSVYVTLLSTDFSENTIVYDLWSNIKYEGIELDDIENEFVTKKNDKYFLFNQREDDAKVYPVIKGINDNVTIRKGDIHKVYVDFKKPYTHSNYVLMEKCYYRIYVEDGNNKIIVSDWDSIYTLEHDNFFFIDSNDFQPNKYKVEIKYNRGREIRSFDNVLTFNIEK